MKEHPILFSGEMVRAILEGRKTMTRRVVRTQPPGDATSAGVISGGESHGEWSWLTGDPRDCETWDLTGSVFRCPYGTPGDGLWVRETWAVGHRFHRARPSDIDSGAFVHYRADGLDDLHVTRIGRGRWRPSIHMPRWVCRLTLEVVSVRVERLNTISEEDAIAEGCASSTGPIPELEGKAIGSFTIGRATEHHTAAGNFQILWDSINAKRGYGWETNPWVWIIEFKPTHLANGGRE